MLFTHFAKRPKQASSSAMKSCARRALKCATLASHAASPPARASAPAAPPPPPPPPPPLSVAVTTPEGLAAAGRAIWPPRGGETREDVTESEGEVAPLREALARAGETRQRSATWLATMPIKGLLE